MDAPEILRVILSLYMTDQGERHLWTLVDDDDDARDFWMLATVVPFFCDGRFGF